MDSIYERINDDTELITKETTKSEIQPFFSGKTIFLTGSTGFIGKCLVEKILRTCWDIKRLYILVRVKKNEPIQQRVKKYFDNIVFQRLRRERPDFQKQVTIIEGDLSLPGIALSPDDRRLLIETVDLIIHNAAMVIFSAKVSTLLRTNVLGTKEMLELAAECHHLKGFLYVSTAYSHCYLKTIEEKFYDTEADLQIVHDMIKADMENEAGLSSEVLKSFLGSFPNAYIFTKAMAESIVQEYARKVSFPCGVFRMSIVISSYREPLRSWCGNMNGPTYIFLIGALGLLHVVYIAKNGVPDLIPVDMTANACLVSLWDLVENKKDCREGCVYNYGSSTMNPITYPGLRDRVLKYGQEYPSIRIATKYFMIMAYNYPLFVVYHMFFHYLPALVLDLLGLLVLKKPKLISIVLKGEKHKNELIYFATKNWNIKTEEMIRIWDKMNPTDQKLFFSDLRKLDWEDYCTTYWQGMRVYLLKESMDNVIAARQRYRLICIRTYIFFGMLLLLVLYVFFKLISCIFAYGASGNDFS